MKQGEKTKNHIISIANELFYHQGYRHTAISDMVKASGLSKGHIMYHFNSKEAILKAVIDKRINDIQSLLLGWDTEFAHPRDRIKRFIEMLLISHTDLILYGCPMGTLRSELGKDNSKLLAIAREMFETFRRWLAIQFIELGLTKERSADLALELLARAQGICIISHVYRDDKFLNAKIKELKNWIESEW